MNQTKVFICWSGERSKQLATALRHWLPDVLPGLEAWMSDHDIAAGARWDKTLTDQLNESSIGILCLTAENLTEPWVLFEAGALSRSLPVSFVIPYRLGLSEADVSGPLALFQSVGADASGTRKLLTALSSCSEPKMAEDRLDRFFDVWWPSLSARINAIPVQTKSPKNIRDDRALLEEILQLARSQMATAVSPGESGKRTEAVSSFKDLMERLTDLLRSTEAGDTVRYLAYTPVLGFLSETEDLWKKLQTCMEQRADQIDMICLKDDDLAHWHGRFAGRNTARGETPVEASLIQKANEVSRVVLGRLEAQGRPPMRRPFAELPGFYVFKNSTRALVVAPVGVPLMRDADRASIEKEWTESKVEMFGIDTNVPQIVKNAGLAFVRFR